jgi:hypothetical protein
VIEGAPSSEKSEPLSSQGEGFGEREALREQSAAAAARLATLLADFDPSAATFLEEHEAALRQFFPSDMWAQFEQHVADYAFAEARDELQEAVEGFARR